MIRADTHVLFPALYSHISAGQYLEAAFLWLLTRLIREELVNAANSQDDASASEKVSSSQVPSQERH